MKSVVQMVRMKSVAGTVIVIVFLLLQTPNREGWGSAIILRETATGALCPSYKAAGVPHAGRPLLRSKPLCWSFFLLRQGAAIRRPFIEKTWNHGLRDD